MKLHVIALKNLNSLYGPQRIDLDRDLGGAPLFMILGQTGAGKSTILDAICLALFGETPRLNRVRGQLHTDSRLIMSQGAGECSASVVFSKIGPGGLRERFRASWRCRRARLSPSGRLQAAERKLEHIDEDGQARLIVGPESPRAEIDERFAAALEGLTVEDFKRTTLLAQGEFSAFIRASQAERAAILERLTRTDVFKRLGQQAAARMRESRAALETLEKEASDSAMIGVDALKALRGSLKEAQGQRARLQDALQAASTDESWWLKRLDLRRRYEASDQALRAAQIARDGAGEDIERLELDARCSAAEVLLRELHKIDADLARASHEAGELAAARDAQRGQAERAQADLDAAKAAKALAVEAAEAARPQLAEARALRQALRRAEDEWRLARHADADAQEQAADAAEASLRCEESLQEALARRDKLQRADEKVAHLEALTRDLSTLKLRHQHLGQHAAQLQSRIDSRDVDLAALQRLQADARVLRSQLDEALIALQPFVQARKGALDRLRGAMAGADDLALARQSLQRALGEHEARRALLADLNAASSELQALAGRRVGVEDQRAALAAQGAALADREAQDAEKLDALTAQADDRAEHLDDVKLALSMSRERARLKAGRPCPLCGSPDHPYVESGDLDEQDALLSRRYDELAGQLAEDRARLGALQQRRSAASAERASVEARADLVDQQLLDIDLQRRRVERLRLDALHGAGLEADAPVERVEAARQGLDQQLARLQAALRDLEAGASLLQTCDQTVQEGQRAVETLAASCEALQARAEDRRLTVERYDTEIEDLQREIDGATRELVDSLTAHQIPIPLHEGVMDLGWAVEEATRRMGQFLDRRNALAQAQSQLTEHLGQRDALKARAEEAALRLAERAASCAARQEAAETLRSQAEAHPYAGHPAKFELAIEESIQEADARVEAAQQEATAMWRRFERTQALDGERRSLIATLTERRRHVVDGIREQLGALEIIDLEALTEALLSPMERQQLAALQRRLDEALAVARAGFARAQDELDAHDEGRPRSLDLLAESAETLARRREDLQRQCEAAAVEVRVAQGALAEQERLAEGLEGLQSRLLAANREANRWKTLHKLIGRREGEEFRLFAQILNLQKLLDSANTRLAILEPRYELVTATDAKGAPILDFSVRDAHHCGQVRPLTTLSGGETFLVSLALALALSDHHSPVMPIETLLLDEGISALDRQALDTALGALERLHGDGTQIGIISHIDSLRERIQARIVVEKIGGGRSALRFEANPSAGDRGM